MPTHQNQRFVFIDTCIYRQAGFNPHSGVLARLRRQVEARELRLIVTNTTIREIRSQLMSRGSDIRKQLKDIANSGLSNLVAALAEITSPVELEANLADGFISFLQSMNPVEVDADRVSLGELHQLVESGELPYSKLKQSQYKDIAVSLALRDWATANKNTILIVSKDADVRLLTEGQSWCEFQSEVPDDTFNSMLLSTVKQWVAGQSRQELLAKLHQIARKGDVESAQGGKGELLDLEDVEVPHEFWVHDVHKHDGTTYVTVQAVAEGTGWVQWEYVEYDHKGNADFYGGTGSPRLEISFWVNGEMAGEDPKDLAGVKLSWSDDANIDFDVDSVEWQPPGYDDDDYDWR